MWLAAGPDAVWIRGQNALIRVDPATNAVVARVPTPPIGFGYAAVGERAVWQTSFGGSFLLRIDPTTNGVVATIPLGDDAAPEGVGVTAGAVWVALHHQGTVARIDPGSNEIVARIPVGRAGNDGPLKLAAGSAGVWVDVPNANEVVHIDPATNAVVGRVRRSGIPVLDGESVYVVARSEVLRIDPAGNQVTATTQLPAIAADGAAGLGAVWVTTETGLVRIDQTGKVIGKLGLRKGDVAVGAGSVWVAEYGTGRLQRIDPR